VRPALRAADLVAGVCAHDSSEAAREEKNKPLPNLSSELHLQRAGDGIRTHDIQLGRLTL
jgi:hypothetical protein